MFAENKNAFFSAVACANKGKCSGNAAPLVCFVNVKFFIINQMRQLTNDEFLMTDCSFVFVISDAIPVEKAFRRRILLNKT